MNSQTRLQLLRERLDKQHVDGMAVVHPPNVAYVTGFENVFDDAPAHVALVTRNSATLVTDGCYSEAATLAATDTEWSVRTATASLAEALREVAHDEGATTVAIEDTLTYRRHLGLATTLGEQTTTSSGWVESLRAVKDAAEIERIEAAQQLTDAAFVHITSWLRPGVTETEIALELEFFMRRNGSDDVAFEPIVASGPNSARPHARVSARAVQPGDFVKMDFGARVDGYCSDMTRTVVMGQASERQREFYDAVLAANLAGIAALAPGEKGSEVDAAAREVMTRAGLGALFNHGLGHGVGREIHELPYCSPRSEDMLQSGNVVTIEPGAYESGFGGVRIEDLVVVIDGGGRVLTRSPKDLIEL